MTKTASVTMNSTIQLRSLSQQLENGVVIIGYADQFLELPEAGVDFLTWLDEGLSLAQAQKRFEAQYNPFPDEELLAVIDAFLESEFIAAVDGQSIAPRHMVRSIDSTPPPWIARLFSRPALIAWMLIVSPAAVLWVRTPELWPQRSDFFWTEHYFMVVLVGLLLWLVGMALHELAHLLACRANGIEATITWTQRLGVFPMSQTIMHNVWAVPRGARLVPIAAGMVWDILVMSVLLYLLYFDQIGTLVLPLLATKLFKYYLLTSILALAAQFWLFSKMDGYFLLSALFGQRNLQADTYSWLKSRVSSTKSFDAPAGGMKFIYVYSVITVLWGGLFMGQFLLINLPIKLQLVWGSLLKVLGDVQLTPLEYADGIAAASSQLLFWGLLLYVYCRNTLPKLRSA